jgi:hypothetical protein
MFRYAVGRKMTADLLLRGLDQDQLQLVIDEERTISMIIIVAHQHKHNASHHKFTPSVARDPTRLTYVGGRGHGRVQIQYHINCSSLYFKFNLTRSTMLIKRHAALLQSRA